MDTSIPPPPPRSDFVPASTTLLQFEEFNPNEMCLRLLRWDVAGSAIATSPESALPIVTVPGEHDATVGGARREAATALGLDPGPPDAPPDLANGWSARVHLIHLVGETATLLCNDDAKLRGQLNIWPGEQLVVEYVTDDVVAAVQQARDEVAKAAEGQGEGEGGGGGEGEGEVKVKGEGGGEDGRYPCDCVATFDNAVNTIDIQYNHPNNPTLCDGIVSAKRSMTVRALKQAIAESASPAIADPSEVSGCEWVCVRDRAGAGGGTGPRSSTSLPVAHCHLRSTSAVATLRGFSSRTRARPSRPWASSTVPWCGSVTAPHAKLVR